MSQFLNTLIEISNIAGTNAYRPTLYGVYVSVSSGQARLMTSNGHAAAIRTIDCEIGDVEVFIPLDTIKVIKKLYKPKNTDASLASANGELSIFVSGVPFILKAKGDFPKEPLSALFTRAPVEIEMPSFDAHLLDLLAKALGSTVKRPLTLTLRPTGATDPILVNANDDAYGLIMPRRR